MSECEFYTPGYANTQEYTNDFKFVALRHLQESLKANNLPRHLSVTLCDLGVDVSENVFLTLIDRKDDLSILSDNEVALLALSIHHLFFSFLYGHDLRYVCRSKRKFPHNYFSEVFCANLFYDVCYRSPRANTNTINTIINNFESNRPLGLKDLKMRDLLPSSPIVFY